jgi:hypothetical protein
VEVVNRDGEGDRPRLFRELSTSGKIWRVVVILFLMLHLTSLLVGGAIPQIRSVFTPVIFFYADALKMTNSWGMFGKPPTSTNVQIEAVMPDGKTIHVLSTTDAHQRSLWERIVDTRMRKFEGRLAEPADMKRLGDAFLDWFCKVGKEQYGTIREVRIRNVFHETRDDDDRLTRSASSTIIGSRRCDGTPVNRIPIPSRPKPTNTPPAGGEGDL